MATFLPCDVAWQRSHGSDSDDNEVFVVRARAARQRFCRTFGSLPCVQTIVVHAFAAVRRKLFTVHVIFAVRRWLCRAHGQCRAARAAVR
jgi:hypothetical protein